MGPGESASRDTALGVVAGYAAAALILLGMLMATMVLPGVAYPY